MSKLYSTPRSGGYINGMLDTIARHLVDTGRLLKSIEPQRVSMPKGGEKTENE